jgi:hypothetical protein
VGDRHPPATTLQRTPCSHEGPDARAADVLQPSQVEEEGGDGGRRQQGRETLVQRRRGQRPRSVTRRPPCPTSEMSMSSAIVDGRTVPRVATTPPSDPRPVHPVPESRQERRLLHAKIGARVPCLLGAGVRTALRVGRRLQRDRSTVRLGSTLTGDAAGGAENPRAACAGAVRRRPVRDTPRAGRDPAARGVVHPSVWMESG